MILMNHQTDENWEDDPDLRQVAIDNGQEYHCDSCGRDVTRKVRIRCMECDNYDVCIMCFASGEETNAHKRSHSYRVLRALDFSIFESSWTAAEELALVDGIEIFGLGNWEQVAEHVGTKSFDECSSHWIRSYLESERWPLPDSSKGIIVASPSPSPCAQPSRKRERRGPPVSSCPESHEIQGYMPMRNEFCVESENEAEHSIKDLEFCESDTPLDKELKLAMLSIYNSVLDRRHERKKTLLEYDLLDLKHRSKREKEIYQTFGVFCRMQSPSDFKKFVSNVLNEMSLRERIADLQEYRRMGLRTKAEVEVYKKEKLNRIKAACAQARPSVKTSKKQYASLHQKSSKIALHNDPSYIHDHTVPITDAVKPQDKPDILAAKAQTPLDNSGALSSQEKEVEIPGLDENQLLAPSECQLCENLKIYPKAYLAIKKTILEEYATRGTLRMCRARKLLKIDVNKTSRIYNFFVEMGWIKIPVYDPRGAPHKRRR